MSALKSTSHHAVHAQPAHQETLDQTASQATQDDQDHQAVLATQDSQATQDHKAHQDHQEAQDVTDHVEIQADQQSAHQTPQETQDSQERAAPQDSQEMLDHQDVMDSQAAQGSQDLTDHQASQARTAPQEMTVQTAQAVLMESAANARNTVPLTAVSSSMTAPSCKLVNLNSHSLHSTITGAEQNLTRFHPPPRPYPPLRQWQCPPVTLTSLSAYAHISWRHNYHERLSEQLCFFFTPFCVFLVNRFLTGLS